MCVSLNLCVPKPVVLVAVLVQVVGLQVLVCKCVPKSVVLVAVVALQVPKPVCVCVCP